MIQSQFYTHAREDMVRQAFSRAALSYDSLTSLHQQVALALLERVALPRPQATVVDIGMGTGWLTAALKNKFPRAHVVGMDFAEGMVAQARRKHEGINVLLADARALPFGPDTIDVSVSNLAYQWVPDLTQAFGLCHRALKPRGVFHFSLFGEQTFRELFDVLDRAEVLPKAEGRRLAGPDELDQALRRAGFEISMLEREMMEMPFKDMLALMRWVKNIGAHRLNTPARLGRRSLLAAARFYEQEYPHERGVSVSFEIIHGIARKKERLA
jgi:malonyl-CoA O-methyltransferase